MRLLNISKHAIRAEAKAARVALLTLLEFIDHKQTGEPMSNSRNNKIISVARAIYEQLSQADFTRADVEELAQKVADRVPFERLGRNLAIKVVSLGIKAAEASEALYASGSDNGAQPGTEAPLDVTPKSPGKTVVPPEEVEVVSPSHEKTEGGGA